MARKGAIRVIVFVFAAAALLAGCGKSAEEKAIEKFVEKKSGGKVTYDASQGKVTVKEGNTTITTGGNVAIPANFPTDVPIYPNTEVLNSVTANDIMSVTVTSRDPIEKIVLSYKDKMKAQGWKETVALTMGNTATLGYEKDKRNATIAVSEVEKGKNGIQIQISQKK